MSARVDWLHLFRIRALLPLIVGLGLLSACINESPATLTIRNNTSTALERVTWSGTDFGDIAPGTAVTRAVNGSNRGSPIFLYIGQTEYFSLDVLVKGGEEATYVFDDRTLLRTYK